MATTVNGEFLGLNGRIGSLVSYKWRGKWVARTFAQKPKNPRTELQQSHRMLFKQEVQLAGRMNWVLRETMDAVAAEQGMTACNYFIKRNQAAFGVDDGHLAVDWSALVLSEGPVAPVAFGAPSITEGTTLSIAFERNPLHMRADNYDRVYVYLYCPDIELGFLTAPVYRREQRLSVVLPDIFAGHEVQLWGMVQDAAGRWSETLYIGCGPIENTVEEPLTPEPNNEESLAAAGHQSSQHQGSNNVSPSSPIKAPPDEKEIPKG